MKTKCGKLYNLAPPRLRFVRTLLTCKSRTEPGPASHVVALVCPRPQAGRGGGDPVRPVSRTGLGASGSAGQRNYYLVVTCRTGRSFLPPLSPPKSSPPRPNFSRCPWLLIWSRYLSIYFYLYRLSVYLSIFLYICTLKLER